MASATALLAQFGANAGFADFVAFYFFDPVVEFPEKPLNGQNPAGRSAIL